MGIVSIANSENSDTDAVCETLNSQPEELCEDKSNNIKEWTQSWRKGWRCPKGDDTSQITHIKKKHSEKGFPWWLSGKESTGNTGDTHSIPDLERSHMPQSNWACAPELLRLF